MGGGSGLRSYVGAGVVGPQWYVYMVCSKENWE